MLVRLKAGWAKKYLAKNLVGYTFIIEGNEEGEEDTFFLLLE